MHDLARQLDQVARRARRMLLTQRVCGVVAAVVVTLAVLGPLDYWLRLPGAVRLGLGLGWLGLAAWRLVPGLVRAWRFTPPRDGLARRLEQRVPALRGRLVSALEFGLTPARFAPPHAAPVTAALAATAVSRTGADAAAAGIGRHLNEMVDPAPTRRWLAAGLAAVAAVAAVLAAAPGPGVTALQRWFAPLGAAAWPARVALDAPPLPAVLPVDTPAELRVGVTRGDAPGLRVWAHHRFVAGPLAGTGAAELMTRQDDAARPAASAKASARRYRLNWDAPAAALRAVQSAADTGVAADVWFTAGDGATAPRRVAWVARPRLLAAAADVRAPAYAAGRVPDRTLDLEPGGDTLAARGGSTVTLRLAFNKTLDAAGDRDAGAAVQLMPAIVALPDATLTRPDPRSAELTWTLRESVTDTVRPVDAHGLSATPPPTLRFVAEPDAPPRVAWETPTADRAVLATARLPVAAEAGDDLAVSWLTVSAAREPAGSDGGSTGAEDSPTPLPEPFVLAQSTDPQASVRVSAVLDLAARGAEPGDVFTLDAEAQDLHAADGPAREAVRAPSRRISVITAAQLAERLRADLAAVRRQAVRLERDQAALAARDPGAPATHTQRAAEQGRLNTRLDAPAAQLNQVAQQIAMNGLDEPALASLVTDAAARATRAREAGVQAAATLDAAGPDADAAAQPQQEAARAALAELSALLDRGRDALGLKLELARLRTEQDRLAQDTRALLPRTVGRDADTLDADTRAALAELAERQAALAEAAATAVSGMQRAAESLATDADTAEPTADQTEPTAEALAAADRARAAAQALAEAAAVAQRQGLAPGLRDSAQAVADNRLAQAGSGQLNALETLDAMLEQLGEEETLRQAILKRRRLELIDRLRRLVADQSAELEALARAADAGGPLAALAAAQSRLWVRTVAAETLARAAGDGSATQADTPAVAGHLVSAAAGQTRAQPALARGSAADARAAETSALSALERALTAALAAEDDATQDATRDERAALRKAYAELADRQDELRTRTAAAVPAPGAALPRRVRAALRGLGAEETALRTDAAALAEQIEGTLVFKQTHARIDAAATTAAETLRAAAPAPDRAARAQSRVSTLLRAMAAALEDPEKTQDFASADPGGGGGGGAGDPPPLVPPLAELLLLRGMQQAVYDETRGLDEQTPADVAARAAELGAEQRGLADLARRLIEQLSPAAPVPNPEPPAQP